ncbi:DUF3048 domain-containing protein [Candidatus Uhrbacteria bacterium]|nr:DUF3048 domain-containing protein [Candidatus Uhrbacteria bacterium]
MLIIALAVVGGGVVVFISFGFGRANVQRAPVVTETPVIVVPPGPRSWLDGTPLAGGAAQPIAAAIVVDNAPEAQPQSGLADAPLVFEVPVEGGRTRFVVIMPVGAGTQPIGPVRSARPYFIGLAQAIGVPLVHVGGSDAAMTILRRSGWPHVNQYFDPPFWRDVRRPSPFNVYTAASNLGAFVQSQGWEDRLRASAGSLWQYADGDGTSGVDDALARLPFDRRRYVVEWDYDVDAGVYIRFQGGSLHRVRSGSDEREVRAANVVVLQVRSRVLDAIGRLEIPALEPSVQPTGTPQAAAVFTGGRRIDGTWNWNMGGQPRFQLLQPDGSPIALRPGTTWVEFVDFSIKNF